MAEPTADITDLYAFPSPEHPGHLVLVLNTLPFAPPSAVFSDGLIYRFRVRPLTPSDQEDGAPFVVSGQAWGEESLIGRAAILDMPVGKGHVVTFNFNPLHRDLNRGDQRMLWNAIINWRAIVGAP